MNQTRMLLDHLETLHEHFDNVQFFFDHYAATRTEEAFQLVRSEILSGWEACRDFALNELEDEEGIPASIDDTELH